MAYNDPFNFGQLLQPQTQAQGLSPMIPQPPAPQPQPPMQAAQNPPPAAPQQQLQPGPPGNPQELQTRAAGWDAFLTHLAQPQNLQALFNSAATLLSPRKPGESDATKIAQGLAVGANTYVDNQFKNQENQRQNEMVNIAKERNQIARDAANDPLNRELLLAQINKINEANSPEEKKKELAILDARLKLIEAQTAREKTTGISGAGSISADVQKYGILTDLYTKQGMGELDAKAKAAKEAFNPDKQFKYQTVAEFKASAMANLMQANVGAPIADIEAQANKLAQEYAMEIQGKSGSDSTGVGGTPPPPASQTLAIQKYNAYIQQLQASQQATPDNVERARQKIISDYGLPPDWRPQ